MNFDLLTSVETRMREIISVTPPSENSIARAALDHMTAGGGRIRARLSLHASVQLGLCDRDSITLATVCELLHNASLIQDDLLDRAALRRGLPSVWARYGDATAVCAGDLLLAGAFAVIGDMRSTQYICPVLSLVHSRTREVILGQGTEQSCSPDTMQAYEAVAIAKSASLLSLPLELSLMVSGNQSFLPGAKLAAYAFATAYQMMDDLEDYVDDMRSGSLNVVEVVLRSNACTYEEAYTRVLLRVEILMQTLIAETQRLPNGCGLLLLAHAETMCAKLSIDVKFPEEVTRSACHAR